MIVAAAVVDASEDLVAVAAAVAAVAVVVETDSPLIGIPSYPLCADDATAAAAAAAAAAAMNGTNVGILYPWVYVDCTVRPALD